MTNYYNENENHNRESIPFSQELKLNFCPTCGKYPEFVHCYTCDKIEVSCECKNFMEWGHALTLETEKLLEHIWNNQALNSKWSKRTMKLFGIKDGSWLLVESDTMFILGSGSVESVYSYWANVLKNKTENRKGYRFYKMVNRVPVLMDALRMSPEDGYYEKDKEESK